MTAREARILTDENLKGEVIKPYMDIIYERILSSAKEGKSSITHPFHDVHKLHYPSRDIKKAIFDCLRTQGYEIIDHSDPDPGHPCSSAYDEIKW